MKGLKFWVMRILLRNNGMGSRDEEVGLPALMVKHLRLDTVLDLPR